MTLAIAAALAAWSKALPAREWLAVSAWLETFFAFQLSWLLDESRFAALVKARQIGASHTFAGWAVLRALLGETTTVVSVGQREADEVIQKCKKHSNVLTGLGSKWATATSKDGEVKFPTTGGRILALPSTSGARGYSGNTLIDEFAYQGKDAPRVWDAASASVMHGFRMRVLSTPNGAAGEFYQLATDSNQNAGWRIWKTTIDDAMRDGMKVDIAECWKMARQDPRVFDQMFRCSFLNSDEMYISPAVLEPCLLDDNEPGPHHHSLVGRLDHFGGIDVGLTNDATAIVTIAKDRQSSRCWVVDSTTVRRTEWTKQQETIEECERLFNWRSLLVDSTGLGAVPTQLLQKKFGKNRVVAVPFTQPKKAELASGLYQGLADRMLHIRRSDTALISDIHQLKRIVTPAGTVKFDADHDANGHADRAWALALAVSATNGPDRQIYSGFQ